MPSNTTETTESFILPKECEDDVGGLKERVRGRAERCPIPSAGYIIDFPSVYGCDDLAAHTVSNASKISSATLEPHITAYTWKILVFFPGRPTIGNTFTVVIPIVSIGSLTMRINEKDGRTTVLKPTGHYHLFHKECTLDIEGDGRLAALVIVPDRLLHV